MRPGCPSMPPELNDRETIDLPNTGASGDGKIAGLLANDLEHVPGDAADGLWPGPHGWRDQSRP